MGRLIRLLPLTLMIILLFGVPVRAENWLKVQPEQVRIILPEIKLWLYPENDQGYVYDTFKPDDIRAFLDDRPLADPALMPYVETGAGSTYFFLFDISGSIPDATFAAIKEGLVTWKQALQPNDKLVLITFGERSTLILDGSESLAMATERIQAIQNSEKHTRLYDSIEKALSLAETAGVSYPERKVLIAITDGVNTVSLSSYEATQKILSEHQTPLYVLGLGDKLSTLHELARASSGDLYPIDDKTTNDVFARLQDRLNRVYLLTLKAADNRIGQRDGRLIVHLQAQDQSASLDLPVTISRWIPDQEPPQVREVVVNSDKQLSISYTEPVAGADSESAYLVRNNQGSVLPVHSAIYLPERQEAVVVLEQDLVPGDYTLEIISVHDLSMEANPVSAASYPFAIQAPPVVEPEPEPEPEPGRLTVIWSQYKGWLIAGASFLFLLLILFIVLLVRAIRRRRKKALPDAPVVVDDHVHVSGRDSRRVVLAHIDANGLSRKLTLQVQSTCIIGRSAQQCDVSIDDSQLSRQHCALSLDQDRVLVQDLQSTNGTYLNGVLVQGKRPLQPNDTIRIGGSTLQIISIGGGSNG